MIILCMPLKSSLILFRIFSEQTFDLNNPFFWNADESTRVYIKYTKTDGDSAAPCSMPKVVNIDVVLTNGTLFYKLKLHKREHVSTSLGPLYSIRSSSHLSLLPEKILPNQVRIHY